MNTSITNDGSFFIIAHWSDIHLNSTNSFYSSTINVERKLREAVDHLNKTTPLPNILIITGDLVDYPSLDDYKLFRLIMDGLMIPYYVIPGNHDNRQMLFDTFQDLGYFSKDSNCINYAINKFPLKIIGFDTVSDNLDSDIHGGYEAEVSDIGISWLQSELQKDKLKPTIIFMHHQPKYTRMGSFDHEVFSGVKKLEEVVKDNSQIMSILCGHLHRHIQFQWGGTTVQVAPSLSIERTLTLDNKMKKEYIDEPTGSLIYLYSDQLGLVCHTDYFGEYKKYSYNCI